MTNIDPRIVQAVQLFNAAQWRESLLAFEAVWLETRDVELKALIQTANLILQLHHGFIMSPRRLVGRACELLDDAMGTTGVDLQLLRQTLHDVATYIPPNDTDLLDIRTLPRVELRWRHGNS